MHDGEGDTLHSCEEHWSQVTLPPSRFVKEELTEIVPPIDDDAKTVLSSDEELVPTESADEPDAPTQTPHRSSLECPPVHDGVSFEFAEQ